MLVVLAALPLFNVGSFLIAVILAKEIEHVLAHVVAIELSWRKSAGLHQRAEQRHGKPLGLERVLRKRLGGRVDALFF